MFTHRNFLHTEAFTQGFFTHRRVYTQKCFTQRSLYAEEFLHTETFTHTHTHTNSRQGGLYTEELLHTETSKHKNCYTLCPQKLLHKFSFPHLRTESHFLHGEPYIENLCAEDLFPVCKQMVSHTHTQTRLHAEGFRHTLFYTRNLLHRALDRENLRHRRWL